jgi:hypothetical protein
MDAGDEHIADLTPEPIILQLIAALGETIIRFHGQLAVKTYVSLTAVQCRAGRMLISKPPKAALIGLLASKSKLGQNDHVRGSPQAPKIPAIDQTPASVQE